MYNILVSNDDGITAAGLQRLVLSLSENYKVYVSAPLTQQSAKSMSLTIQGIITAEETCVPGAELAYVVGGTPADCVKFGLQKCAEAGIAIDYVLSGINLGSNLGTDTHYSGTVGAAVEGALSGYRSIALSVTGHEATQFDYICGMVPELLKLSSELDLETVLNVNAPDLPVDKVRGVKITRCGGRTFDDRFIMDENEPNIYQYDGYLIDYGASGIDNDLVANYQGYATVTPLTLDKTDYSSLEKLRQAACAFNSR